MSVTAFAEAFNQLLPGEQAQFAEVVRRLLSEGIVWREEENDRRVYTFLVRHRELVQDYLAVAGWMLVNDERLAVFQVIHRDGVHRRHLNRDTTVWLLLLRLMYAEQRERLDLALTRYPVVTIGEIYQRYVEFFPGQVIRKKTSLEEALRTLVNLKLIRPAGGGILRVNNGEQQIELLPTLQVVVAANEIAAVAERLREYERGREEEDGGRTTTDE